MNWLEELSVGALLATYRDRSNQTGQQVAALMPEGYTTTTGVSRLENNYSSRPTRELLDRIAPVYGLTPHETTRLYRAADHEPSSVEVHTLQGRMQSTLDEFLCPAYILDYRLRLVAWNEFFARLYDASPEAPLEAPGLSLLRLLFHTQGRPSNAVRLDREEWSRLVEFWLTRFWRATLPLIQVYWYPRPPDLRTGEPDPLNGYPDWLTDFVCEMGALPTPDGDEFTRRSESILSLLRHARRDERVQLIRHELVDRLFVRQGGTRSLLTISEMADARFQLVVLVPVAD